MITNERATECCEDLLDAEDASFVMTIFAGHDGGMQSTMTSMRGSFDPTMLAETLIDAGLQLLRAGMGMPTDVEVSPPEEASNAKH